VALGVGGHLAVNGRIEVGAVAVRELAVVTMEYRLFVQAVAQLEGSMADAVDPDQCGATASRKC
jgi:hypothetical protein